MALIRLLATVTYHLGKACWWTLLHHPVPAHASAYPYQILSEKIESFKIISSIDENLAGRRGLGALLLAPPGAGPALPLAACLPHAAGMPPPRAAGGGHAPAGAPTRRRRACYLPLVFARLLTDD